MNKVNSSDAETEILQENQVKTIIIKLIYTR